MSAIATLPYLAIADFAMKQSAQIAAMESGIWMSSSQGELQQPSQHKLQRISQFRVSTNCNTSVGF